MNSSALAVRSILRLTFVLNSLSKRSQSTRDVAYLPSFPENGEVLTPNVIFTVGSSILIRPNASGKSEDDIVSPMETVFIPAIAHISPALTSSTSFLLRSLNRNRWSTLNGLVVESRPITTSESERLITPLATRPIAILPMWLS